MGIQGLLPFLKNATQQVNISNFKGCTVAVDTYCWLHKGAFACAEKLGRGEKTDQYIFYVVKFVNVLLAAGLKPVMVFDGCRLPSKAEVEKSRRERRNLYKKKAAQFLREGKRSEARDCFSKSIDITPQMALETMQVLRDLGVDCIVAPYEADPQLAFLNQAGLVDLVISEDSDLILFGCEKVLYKMDVNGNGMLIERERLNEVTKLSCFTFDKFRYMCILSGCDYLPSLYGVGLGKACKFFKLTHQTDPKKFLRKLPTYLKLNIKMTEEYIDGFIQADNTFLYQLVYDPVARELVPLNPYPADVDPDGMSYAGAYMSSKKAFQLALGNIDVHTGNQLASYNPDTFTPPSKNSKFRHITPVRGKNVSGWSIWNSKGRTSTWQLSAVKDLPQTTKGQEVTVKFNHKRARPGCESADVKSNNELTELYTECEPTNKRPKLSEGDTSFASVGARRDDVSESDDDICCGFDRVDGVDVCASQSSSTGSLSPESDNEEQDESFSHALEEACSPENVPDNSVDSKPRNRFAVNGLAKKRFNIMKPDTGAIPQVRSRFFITKPVLPVVKQASLDRLCEKNKKLASTFKSETSQLCDKFGSSDFPAQDTTQKVESGYRSKQAPSSEELSVSYYNKTLNSDLAESSKQNTSVSDRNPFLLTSAFSWKKNLSYGAQEAKICGAGDCENNSSHGSFSLDFSSDDELLPVDKSVDIHKISSQYSAVSKQSSQASIASQRLVTDQSISIIKTPTLSSFSWRTSTSTPRRTPLFKKKDSIINHLHHDNIRKESSDDQDFTAEDKSVIIDLCDDDSRDGIENLQPQQKLDMPKLPDFSNCSKIIKGGPKKLGMDPFISRKIKSTGSLLGCRSSGLSKNNCRSNKTKKEKDGAKQQKSISSFFNQFKNEKHVPVDKLESLARVCGKSSATRTPLSPCKINTMKQLVNTSKNASSDRILIE